MNRAIKPLALTAILILSMSAATATPVVFGTVTANVDTTATFFGGTLLASAVTPISNSSYTGSARSAVYDTGSGLDFYYQFSNSSQSVNGIERFTGYDFGSLGASVVDVFQTASAFGIFTAGTELSDTADRTALGVIGFNFLPNGNSKINPGTTSYTQIVRTSARNFSAGNFGLLDGIGDNARGFAPSLAVPEPASYSLLLAGAALVLLRKGRNIKRG
jgi:hypothetical protein